MAAKAGVSMYPERFALLCACLLFAACASSRAPGQRIELALGPEVPERVPVVQVTSAQLIPYPDLDAAWVRGPDAEIYHAEGLFYCYSDGNWFYSHTLGGTWEYVEMSRVPPDLFRARGAERPTLVRAAPDEESRQPGPSLRR